MNTYRRRVTAGLTVLFFVVGVISAAPLFAQVTTATVLGVVSDSGGVLPGATVTVRNVDTGLIRTVPTAGDGSYRLPALPVGPYEITVELAGFRTAVRSGVTLQVEQQAVLDFELELGAITETVTVTGEAPLVETTRSVLGAVVTEADIALLPLEGRNYIGLTMMQPGVTESRTVSSGTYTGVWFSSSGAPPRSNGFSLDGADLRNITGVSTSSVTGATLGLDGIQEYRILTNAFPAEYGGAMGSQTVMVSKSGINRFNGTGFLYHRDKNMEASNYFDLEGQKPEFQRDNVGGSLGGPIRENRMFFHATVEYARLRRGVTKNPRTLPLAAREDGGLVPEIWPAIKPLIDLYPLPNAKGNRYNWLYTTPGSDLYGQVRLDANLSQNSTLFARYTTTRGDIANATNWPGFETDAETRNTFVTLSESHILSSNVVSTTRASYSRPDSNFSATYPDMVLSDPRYNFMTGQAMGTIGIGGVTTMGPSGTYPRAFAGKQYAVSNDTNISVGRSAWKFGVRVRRMEQFVQQSFSRGGQASFANATAFNEGYFNYTRAPTVGSFTDKTLGFTQIGVYLQNDFRATDNLTLNLGVRYEPNTRYRELNGRESAVRNLMTDSAATLGPMFKNNSLKNVSPRVGFAWDVRGDGRTAVRGAFARLYDAANLGTPLVQSVAGTPPFATLSRVNRGYLTVPFQLPTDGAGRSLRVMDYDLGSPSMWHYNVAVEQQLFNSMALTVAYAGSTGVDLIRTKEGNPRPPSSYLPDGRPFWTGKEPRESPHWKNVELKQSDSSSRYNSLQVKLNQRLTRGLQFQNAFTWAKAMDNYAGLGGIDMGGQEAQTGDNPYDRDRDWAPIANDVRFNYRFNMTYRVPDAFESGSIAGALFNTWQVATIVQATSGQPFTPAVQTNRSRNGVLGGKSGNDRPNLLPGIDPRDVTKGVSRGCEGIPAGTKVGTPERWFDPCAFSIPMAGTIGTVERNSFRMPGFSRVDVSLMKSIPTGGTTRTELRIDVFNVLNQVNFIDVNRVVFAARRDGEAPLGSAGEMDEAAAARQAQVSLRFSF